jgi:hypothetical protein
MMIPPPPGISWDAEADYEFWGAGEPYEGVKLKEKSITPEKDLNTPERSDNHTASEERIAGKRHF